MMTRARSLYICYFGLREPLVQTQVLPYLRELAKSGAAIFLLTFEAQRWDQAQAREQLRADGIEWFASRYHKRPTVPATLFDILAGALRAILIVYVGSLGHTYMPREMAEFFAAAKAADARVFPLILTQSRPELIREHLAAFGFASDEYRVGFASAAELPSHLAASDIAISFV